MSSVKPPDLFSPEACTQVAGAVVSVAELSFFADVQPCDRGRFDELAATIADSWIVAMVHFREGGFSGALSCSLPQDLARNLLDAFTGRDPQDAGPDRDALFDLVGELSNMICGTWLTRMATAQTFTLSRPVVQLGEGRPAVGDDTVALMTINDWPLLVSVACLGEDSAVAAGF